MLVTRVSPMRWVKFRARVIKFVAKYKDKHITPESREKLRNLDKRALEEPGTLILLATDQKRFLGILVCQSFGEVFSIVVVRSGVRSKGVGKQLLRTALEMLGKLHVEIASDNVPSIKLAFACGLLGYGAFVRDNGQVVIQLKTFAELA